MHEKSQIQALDRTQPGLPIKKGRCSTMTHDYQRNGTSTLFTALETLQGKVVGECHERHRHLLAIIRKRSFLNGSRIHLIDDTAEFGAQVLKVAVGDGILLEFFHNRLEVG